MMVKMPKRQQKLKGSIILRRLEKKFTFYKTVNVHVLFFFTLGSMITTYLTFSAFLGTDIISSRLLFLFLFAVNLLLSMVLTDKLMDMFDEQKEDQRLMAFIARERKIARRWMMYDSKD